MDSWSQNVKWNSVLFWDVTASQGGVVYGNTSWILEMDSISIRAITWWRNCNSVHLYWLTCVEFQVELWAIPDCYSSYCHIVAPIKPHWLENQQVLYQNGIHLLKMIKFSFGFSNKYKWNSTFLPLAWFVRHFQ